MNQDIHPKITALFALEAMMIENSPEVYKLESYVHQTFYQIEKIRAAERPERLLNKEEFRTFQNLISAYTGGERRAGRDRRKEDKPIDSERRRDHRRFAA